MLVSPQNSPKLFVVSVSLGHPDDISPRARETLKAADLIAAEDTRKSGILLKHLEITPKAMLSYYDHKEQAVSQHIIQKMLQDKII